MQKWDELVNKMSEYALQDVMVAFSGGVDSSLLLKMACEAAGKTGKKVYGVTVQTKLHPSGELEEAKKTAEEIGALHLVVHVDELEEAGIRNNPTDRCYLCKKHLFQKMKNKAEGMGIYTILEGTNEDDLHVYRPGIRALKELEIISPLAEAHMTKEEVRKLAEEYGLSVASKPATPCLATRFPYGAAITYEKMRQVEAGENYLRSLLDGNIRLRVHGDIARIEVDGDKLPILVQYRREITAYFKQLGYRYVTLDLEGFRSGSMDADILAKMASDQNFQLDIK